MTTTLISAIQSFLQNIEQPLTAKAYRSDLLGSTGFLAFCGCKPGMDVSGLTEEHGVKFLQAIMHQKPSSRQRRAAALREFFRYCATFRLANVSTDRLNGLIKNGRFLKGAKSKVGFNEEGIRKILAFAEKWHPKGKKRDRQRQLRARAFVMVLRDTGLRVHEICKLRVGDVDWKNGTAPIVGKGDRQAVVMFGKRSLAALKDYLRNRPDTSDPTPLFVRHDQKSGKRVLPISPATGEAIIHDLAALALGTDYDPHITCHSFRHFCATSVLRQTNNLKTTKEYLRHSNVATTEKYAHLAPDELMRTRDKVFA